MSNLSQSETREIGNTKRSISRGGKYSRWHFRLCNYTREDIESIRHNLKNEKYIFQEEICPTTNTPHLQGRVEFNTRKYLSGCKKIHNKATWLVENNEEADIKYCSNPEKRAPNGKCFTNMYDEKIFISKLSYETLRPWQKEIEDMILETPDDRSIHWYWEPTGNVGKTEFIKYLLTKYSFCEFSRAQKSADILTIASTTKSVYLLDFARSQEGFAPWNALEQLKDGLISDSKLKKKTNNVVIYRPHVICFANWKPVVDISEDKVIIHDIEQLIPSIH